MTSQQTGVHCLPPAAAEASGRRDHEDSLACFKTWMERPCRPEENAVIADSMGDPEKLRDHILKQMVGSDLHVVAHIVVRYKKRKKKTPSLTYETTSYLQI